MEYVPTKDMIADMMTSILPGPELKRLRELVGLMLLEDAKRKSGTKKEC